MTTESKPETAFRPDPRFFDTAPPLAVLDAVQLAGAEIIHSDTAQRLVTHASSLRRAGEGAVVFAHGQRDLEDVLVGEPALVLTTDKGAKAAIALFPEATIAISKSPKGAFAMVARALHTPKMRDVSAAAGISSDAKVANGARIAKSAVVMAGAEIGPDAVIGPCAVIGPGVVIGRGTQIGANATVSHAIVGQDCRFLSGARVGEAGFGYVPTDSGLLHVPQLGSVIVEDQVDLGANTTVDRGALGDTVIGFGTKIDNLCQIAHNCRLGRHVVIAAQTGISGSCVLGDGVMIGGQAGLTEHLTIGDGAVITAKSATMKDVPPGEKWGGIPARPAREWMRDVVALSNLSKKR